MMIDHLENEINTYSHNKEGVKDGRMKPHLYGYKSNYNNLMWDIIMQIIL